MLALATIFAKVPFLYDLLHNKLEHNTSHTKLFSCVEKLVYIKGRFIVLRGIYIAVTLVNEAYIFLKHIMDFFFSFLPKNFNGLLCMGNVISFGILATDFILPCRIYINVRIMFLNASLLFPYLLEDADEKCVTN